jgi:hypothetical protein
MSGSSRAAGYLAAALALGVAIGFVAARHPFTGDYSSPPGAPTPAFAKRVTYDWIEGTIIGVIVAVVIFGSLLLVDRASRRARGVQPRHSPRS